MADVISSSDRTALRETLKVVRGVIRAKVFGRIHHYFADKVFDAERGLKINLPVSRSQSRGAGDRVAGRSGSVVPSNVLAVEWSLSPLPVDPRTASFVDLGSGAGRAMMSAADHHFKQVIGLEIDEKTHNIANENLGKVSEEFLRCSRIENILGDATRYVFPTENLVVYLDKDWTSAALDQILTRLKFSYDCKPRPIFVIYVNPAESQVFDRYKFLKPLKLRFWSRIKLTYFCPYAVTIYRTFS